MSTTDDNNNHNSGDTGEITSNKKKCTSCEQTNVDNITEDIDSMGVSDMSTCANCGEEGNSDNMNICNRCKLVKYCNAACKKKHRSKHKKKCDRRVAELHDEKLFKEIEPAECPICMLPLSSADQATVGSCCGKRICNGCRFAMFRSEEKDLCAFCRAPPPSNEEMIKRTKKLMDKGNGEGYFLLAGYYARGLKGLPQDWNKTNELLLKAGELGCTEAYCNLGNSYRNGDGVQVDKKKANHYFELAAMGGDITARHNLGWDEWEKGNIHRAMRHWVLAARAGDKTSLDNVKKGFTKGVITKDEYANTLRAYQKRQNEMKSDERDEAAKVLAEMRRRGYEE